MVNENIDYSYHPLAEYICRLENNDTLLDDSPLNVVEVVGILKSYGIVLESYSQNLDYIASYQFLNFFPLFKYFNGEISIKKIVKHLKHQRINYEYAEYCVRTMMWHGGGDLDVYLDSEEFIENVNSLISTKFKYNLLVQVLHKVYYRLQYIHLDHTATKHTALLLSFYRKVSYTHFQYHFPGFRDQ